MVEQIYRQVCAKVYGYVNGFFFSITIPYFCAFIILLMLLNRRKRKECGRQNKYVQLVYTLSGAIYLTIVLQITLLGRNDGNVNTILTFFSSYIQLWKQKYEIIYDMVFNVLLFVPMGMLFGSNKSKKKSFLLMFTISFFVESTQFLTGRGIFELSDLVHNTLGGVVGVVLGCIKKLKSYHN